MKTVTYEIGDIGRTDGGPPKWVYLGLSRRDLKDEEADGDKSRPRITLFVEIDGVRVSEVKRQEGGSIIKTAWQAIKDASANHEMFLASDEEIVFLMGYAAYASKGEIERDKDG